MALDFISCGNSQLEEAAYKWAGSHGYKSREHTGSADGPKWKRFRD